MFTFRSLKIDCLSRPSLEFNVFLTPVLSRAEKKQCLETSVAEKEHCQGLMRKLADVCSFYSLAF